MTLHSSLHTDTMTSQPVNLTHTFFALRISAALFIWRVLGLQQNLFLPNHAEWKKLVNVFLNVHPLAVYTSNKRLQGHETQFRLLSKQKCLDVRGGGQGKMSHR